MQLANMAVPNIVCQLNPSPTANKEYKPVL